MIYNPDPSEVKMHLKAPALVNFSVAVIKRRGQGNSQKKGFIRAEGFRGMRVLSPSPSQQATGRVARAEAEG